MATTQEKAEIANHIYDAPKEGGMFGEWKYEVKENPATGFKGGIYTRGDEKVVAYAGSDFGEYADVAADCQIVSGMLSGQLQDAVDLFKQAGKDQVTEMTGHSLGGALAQFIGVEFGKNAETFNAPGIEGLVASYKGDFGNQISKIITENPAVKIISHLTKGDPVSGIGKQMGTELW